jgi:predicted RNA binding protein YcfA (HicA-like mRNA interferase family)
MTLGHVQHSFTLWSGREACAILRAHGFEQMRPRASLRCQGRHIIMQKALEGSAITVPVPDHE